MALELTSTAFANGDPIPMKYTCDDQDISPPLQWKDPPEGCGVPKCHPYLEGLTP